MSKPGLVAMTVPGGVDWKAPDGKPSDLIFLIAAPDTEANVHLEVLAKLSALLMHPEFPAALRAATTVEEFLATIDDAEAAYDAQHAAKSAPAAKASTKDAAPRTGENGLPLILAITACPTGIAHTYMAAENLEKVAGEMGVTIKVETQGSVGTKNALTAEEVAACKGIIIAADKGIELSRFDGKPLYSTNVSAGINDAEGLINKILNDEAPICHAAGGASAPASAEGKTEGLGSSLYKHLMNGVSHMLPFVVGGGILMAVSFLVDQAGMGTSSYGSSTPLAAFFNLVGNQAFNFMLPILAGYISMSIADRPGLAPGFVGGWIAKQGFTLGYLATAMDAEAQGALISGGFIAALFAGFAAGYLTLGFEKLCDRLPDSLEGIKPVLLYPLVSVFGIGLVMLALNPIFAAINTWLTDVLNGMGTGNLMLPSCIVGSAIAGAISAGFGCTSPAPHGGAWVIAVIGNPACILWRSLLVPRWQLWCSRS